MGAQDKGLFFQNTIAIIWDFDMTLSPHYMQEPLFDEYGIDAKQFWADVKAMPKYYAQAGVTVTPDICYLNLLLSYAADGRLPGLTNTKLRELGSRIEFFSGMPEFFDRIENILETRNFAEGDLHLEHYVVSTGLAEMIRGSGIADKLSGIWACEFIEQPAISTEDLSAPPKHGQISQIARCLDHTTKTRALFEINKGVNKVEGRTVNDMIPEEDRRVPFENMIYVADGPSDIPSFSVVRKYGGLAYAVYSTDSVAQFAQVEALHDGGRVNMIGPADYREGSPTDMYLRLKVREIAQRIMDRRKKTSAERVGRGPVHLDDVDD